MKITIDHLSAGAARAEGITVIIDVFRAYSMESYAFYNGVERIYPVADMELAYAMKRREPSLLLAGERHGKMAEGFDFGNSPSAIEYHDLHGKRMIHTTSAGTQGIRAAVNAQVILLGALVNARATAAYIESLGIDRVSLVCMGNENVRPAEEDIVCAAYIQALLNDEPFDKAAAVAKLRHSAGLRFFHPEDQSFAPERDFYLCTLFDRFPFALRVERDEDGRDYTRRIDEGDGFAISCPTRQS